MFEYSIGTRSCRKDCKGSVDKGCTLKCAKVRYPRIQDILEAQGFEVNVPGGEESFNTYVMGERVVGPYDRIIFCKRVGGGRAAEGGSGAKGGSGAEGSGAEGSSAEGSS